MDAPQTRLRQDYETAKIVRGSWIDWIKGDNWLIVSHRIVWIDKTGYEKRTAKHKISDCATFTLLPPMVIESSQPISEKCGYKASLQIDNGSLRAFLVTASTIALGEIARS